METKMYHPKSKCCGADMRVEPEEGDEGTTRYYVCTKCEKACDEEEY